MNLIKKYFYSYYKKKTAHEIFIADGFFPKLLTYKSKEEIKKKQEYAKLITEIKEPVLTIASRIMSGEADISSSMASEWFDVIDCEVEFECYFFSAASSIYSSEKWLSKKEIKFLWFVINKKNTLNIEEKTIADRQSLCDKYAALN